jgi:hypothetical protein
MATSFSGGKSRSTWRETLTIGKQLVTFITCACESIADVILVHYYDVILVHYYDFILVHYYDVILVHYYDVILVHKRECSVLLYIVTT